MDLKWEYRMLLRKSGLTTKEIAERLDTTPETVIRRINNVYGFMKYESIFRELGYGFVLVPIKKVTKDLDL